MREIRVTLKKRGCLASTVKNKPILDDEFPEEGDIDYLCVDENNSVIAEESDFPTFCEGLYNHIRNFFGTNVTPDKDFQIILDNPQKYFAVECHHSLQFSGSLFFSFEPLSKDEFIEVLVAYTRSVKQTEEEESA